MLVKHYCAWLGIAFYGASETNRVGLARPMPCIDCDHLGVSARGVREYDANCTRGTRLGLEKEQSRRKRGGTEGWQAVVRW